MVGEISYFCILLHEHHLFFLTSTFTGLQLYCVTLEDCRPFVNPIDNHYKVYNFMDDQDFMNLTPKDNRKRLRRSASAISAAGGTLAGEEQKKVVHRDIERQRRQEMANLYASLRALLPLEYIKGKRSISDHMHQSVGYINHLRGNIKELEIKRDKLKKLYVIPGEQEWKSSSSSVINNINVKVSLCWSGSGIEILVMSGSSLLLSRIMQVLYEEIEEINVVNCFSTAINQMVLHTIQSEITNLTCINLSALQRKLNDRFCN